MKRKTDEEIIASVREEFAAAEPVTTESASEHVAAMRTLHALGIARPTERQYAAALTDARGGRRGGDMALEAQLAGAEALAELAMARLAEQGLADDATAFIAEFEQVEREFGLTYRGVMTIEVGQVAFDPALLTVEGLSRCSEGEYKAALAWVASERARRAERATANEERVRQATRSLLEGVEERHAAQARWTRRNLPGL